MEAGIVDRHNLLWHTPKPECFTGANLILQVGLEQSSPAVIILLGGTLAAIILLIIELFWHKYESVSFKIQSIIDIIHKFIYN